MYGRSTPSHEDYEVGDTVRVKMATTELLVEVESKADDIKKGSPGWTGTVVEVLDAMYPDTNGNTPGTCMWGRTSDVKEVK